MHGQTTAGAARGTICGRVFAKGERVGLCGWLGWSTCGVIANGNARANRCAVCPWHHLRARLCWRRMRWAVWADRLVGMRRSRQRQCTGKPLRGLPVARRAGASEPKANALDCMGD